MTGTSWRKSSKVAAGFSVLVAVALLPGLILSIMGEAALASITTLAALGTMIPALLASRRLTAYVVIVLPIASALALPASTRPILAAVLLGAVGFLTGVAARWGGNGIVTMAAISIVFLVATPPDLPLGLSSELEIAAVTGGAALWGAATGLLLRRLRRSPHKDPPEPMPYRRVMPYAITLTIVVGGAGWIVVQEQWSHGGGWFIMTFLLVLQPYLQDAWKKTVQRATGTVIGVLLAAGLYFVAEPFPLVLYVVGAGCAVAALTVKVATTRPYWQFVTLLTPAVVLLEGMQGSVTQTALQRLGFTLMAVGFAVALELALAPIYRHDARKNGIDHY